MILAIERARELCPGAWRVQDGTHELTGVQIDSRRVRPGDLFVGIRAGAEFVDDALERGAAATLVPDDVFAAMAALGHAARDGSDARVVAITGSTGKTSTKDILAALCRPHARTVAAESGHNNEIGLPLTLTRIEADTEIVIAEMGMRGLGQIAELCALAQPHVAVITNIGPVHLELVGTVQGVAQAKAEAIEALPPDGVGIVPAGARELDPFLAGVAATVQRFGGDGDIRLLQFSPPMLVADVLGTRVELEVPFTARHQASNTLAALGAYKALGLPLDRVAEGAPEITFSPWRGEEHELPGGGVVINDAYNANPASMRAALEHLVERAAGCRTIAVLGEMAELGETSAAYHAEIGNAARELGVDIVIGVGGELAGEYGATLVADGAEAVELLRTLLLPDDILLVKASRAAGLEAVAEALTGVTT